MSQLVSVSPFLFYTAQSPSTAYMYMSPTQVFATYGLEILQNSLTLIFQVKLLFKDTWFLCCSYSLLISRQQSIYVSFNRMRKNPQNRQIFIIYLSRVLCLSYSCHIPVCRCCGTLSYSLCFTHQIDQGEETEGFKKEGLELERQEMGRLKREGVTRLFNVK